MRRNVGPLEWKVRAVAGVLLLASAFFIEWKDWWEVVPVVLGLVLLATGLTRYCPVNQLFGRRAGARNL